MDTSKYLCNLCCIFSVFILAFLWIFQILFLGSYYKSYKTKELDTAVNELLDAYNQNNLNLIMFMDQHMVYKILIQNIIFQVQIYNHYVMEFKV